MRGNKRGGYFRFLWAFRWALRRQSEGMDGWLGYAEPYELGIQLGAEKAK